MSVTPERGNVILASNANMVAERNDRSIGVILVQTGRLKPHDAEQIMRLQREQNLRFGDAAIQLGLLTQADIEFALSRQFDHPYLEHGRSAVSDSVIAAYSPSSPQVRALSALRSQLLQRWFDHQAGHTALALISSDRSDGRSFVAANLAVSFSQLGKRTLLLDADMRHSNQHVLFGLPANWGNTAGLSAVLSGRSSYEAALHPILGLPDLFVMPAGAQPPNPLELLERQPFHKLLARLKEQFDVILLDSPAATEYPDAQAIVMRAGAAIIVARKNTTRSWGVRGVSERVNYPSTAILGSVLNDF
jgi:protein-tyrosine kinase